ncbi:MAG: hypothetical protein AB7N65_11765 [Vicinamibacterales bacterium]
MPYRLLPRVILTAGAFWVLGLWTPSTAVAQTVDPAFAEFIPSPDHATAVGGTPLVSRYDLSYYQMGATQPFQVNSLGKPAPASDGRIRVNITGLPRPAAGIVYQARVLAVGGGGSAASLPSNSFMFSAGVTPPGAPTNLRIIR